MRDRSFESQWKDIGFSAWTRACLNALLSGLVSLKFFRLTLDTEDEPVSTFCCTTVHAFLFSLIFIQAANPQKMLTERDIQRKSVQDPQGPAGLATSDLQHWANIYSIT